MNIARHGPNTDFQNKSFDLLLQLVKVELSSQEVNKGQPGNVTCKASGGPRPKTPVVWSDSATVSLLGEPIRDRDLTVEAVYRLSSFKKNQTIWCNVENVLSGNKTKTLMPTVKGL